LMTTIPAARRELGSEIARRGRQQMKQQGIVCDAQFAGRQEFLARQLARKARYVLFDARRQRDRRSPPASGP